MTGIGMAVADGIGAGLAGLVAATSHSHSVPRRHMNGGPAPACSPRSCAARERSIVRLPGSAATTLSLGGTGRPGPAPSCRASRRPEKPRASAVAACYRSPEDTFLGGRQFRGCRAGRATARGPTPALAGGRSRPRASADAQRLDIMAAGGVNSPDHCVTASVFEVNTVEKVPLPLRPVNRPFASRVLNRP